MNVLDQSMTLLEGRDPASLHRVIVSAAKAGGCTYLDAFDRLTRAAGEHAHASGGDCTVRRALQAAGVPVDKVESELYVLEAADQAVDELQTRMLSMNTHSTGPPRTIAGIGSSANPAADARTVGDSAGVVVWPGGQVTVAPGPVEEVPDAGSDYRYARMARTPEGTRYAGPEGPALFQREDREAARQGIDMVGRAEGAVRGAAGQQALDAAVQKISRFAAAPIPVEQRLKVLSEAKREGLKALDEIGGGQRRHLSSVPPPAAEGSLHARAMKLLDEHGLGMEHYASALTHVLDK